MADDRDESASVKLPGLVGAASSLAKSGPVRDLLGPAAKVFGKYLGDRAEEAAARWRKQREENLEAHKSRVEEVVGPPKERPPSPRQVDLLNAWIEGAEDINEENEEIASVWQSILAEIYKNEDEVGVRMEVIKKLTPADARILLRLPAEGWVSKRDFDEARLKHLDELGIRCQTGFQDISGPLCYFR
jgi:hypothetical protein